jgi:hypothetical protein
LDDAEKISALQLQICARHSKSTYQATIKWAPLGYEWMQETIDHHKQGMVLGSFNFEKQHQINAHEY